MANKNTKRAIRQARKDGNYFHGSACFTAWADGNGSRNIANKRKSPYRSRAYSA